ncbi:TIGR04219 family outer membrane beta-barrel protein [Colwellia sp. KU-HH00111]|uniref:TIGR04219 family outer membrane beta-barrel protein n=1 Tax=Colwellia sp. KU-HH00111 TaxID=3127652 RepID=UPI00310594EB
MKKAIIAASLATVLCTSAQADTLLGLYVGGQVWANQAKGSLGKEESSQTTFDFDSERSGSYFVALEHPIPLIPNAKIVSTKYDTVGDTTIDVSTTIEGVTTTASVLAEATFDASYIDYTLYYEVFDNDLLTFDFGLTARDLSIDSQITVADNSSDLSSDKILPLLYANAIIGLPFTGYNVFAQADFLSRSDYDIYDYQVGVSYEVQNNFVIDVDVTLGYRAVKLELNDLDGIYSDLTFKGVFVGAVIHF